MILFVAFTCGQISGRPLILAKAQTPEVVAQVLDSLYPGVDQVQWSKKKKTYTADFIYNNQNISITFDRKGHFLNSAEEIQFEMLPSRIKEKIKQFYSPYKIVMITHRRIRDKSEYDVEVILGKHHYILNYNSTGFLLHQYSVNKVDSSETPVG